MKLQHIAHLCGEMGGISWTAALTLEREEYLGVLTFLSLRSGEYQTHSLNLGADGEEMARARVQEAVLLFASEQQLRYFDCSEWDTATCATPPRIQ